MIFGPVFRHELRSAGRKRRYFHARVAIGVLLLGLLWMIFEGASFDAARVDNGRLSIAGSSFVSTVFFEWFSRLTLWGVLLVAPAVAAGAIASERERRTIEYLFTTDLSNGEIVLDKLLARLLTIGALLLATLPVLAIFRLMGGVPGELLLAHFALLAATAAVAVSLALCVGAHCERARDAVSRALGWTFVWLVAAPLGGWLMWGMDRYLGPTAQRVLDWVYAPVVSFLAATNPILVLERASGVWDGVLGVDLDLRGLAVSIGMMLLLAGVLLALCTLAVRRVHLRDASRGAPPKAASAREAKRRTPFQERPFLWKEMHATAVRRRPKTWRGKAVRVVGYVCLIGMSASPVIFFWVSYFSADFLAVTGGRRPGVDDYVGMCSILGATLGSLLVVAAAARASALISSERERDTWLSLLTTPRSAAEIFYAKLLGNLWAFRWPAGVLVAIPATGVLLGWAALWTALTTAVSLTITGAAASAIGLAVSLRTASSTKASTLAVFTLFALSGLYPLMTMVLLMLARAEGDAVWLFSMPAFIPMLIGGPPWLATESVEPVVVASVALGLSGYAVLAWIVSAAAIGDFDRVCGRGTGRPVPAPPAVTS